ncbi:hypothetical protein HYS93_04500 [Candidatus Daviesbacteria bacterium]|nr:hypothetical protein [Candidatus Daviesbacteria bacterium]
MALESWVQKVISMPGEFRRATFYQTELQAVVGTPEANYRMLAVFDNDGYGLEPGVYVQTNLTTEGVNSLPHVRRRISQQVCLALMDDSEPTPVNPEITGLPVVDNRNAIIMEVVAETASGGIVYKVFSAQNGEKPTPLSDALKGRSRQAYSITPLTRFGSFLDRIRRGRFYK